MLTLKISCNLLKIPNYAYFLLLTQFLIGFSSLCRHSILIGWSWMKMRRQLIGYWQLIMLSDFVFSCKFMT